MTDRVCLFDTQGLRVVVARALSTKNDVGFVAMGANALFVLSDFVVTMATNPLLFDTILPMLNGKSRRENDSIWVIILRYIQIQTHVDLDTVTMLVKLLTRWMCFFHRQCNAHSIAMHYLCTRLSGDDSSSDDDSGGSQICYSDNDGPEECGDTFSCREKPDCGWNDAMMTESELCSGVSQWWQRENNHVEICDLPRLFCEARTAKESDHVRRYLLARYSQEDVDMFTMYTTEYLNATFGRDSERILFAPLCDSLTFEWMYSVIVTDTPRSDVGWQHMDTWGVDNDFGLFRRDQSCEHVIYFLGMARDVTTIRQMVERSIPIVLLDTRRVVESDENRSTTWFVPGERRVSNVWECRKIGHLNSSQGGRCAKLVLHNNHWPFPRGDTAFYQMTTNPRMAVVHAMCVRAGCLEKRGCIPLTILGPKRDQRKIVNDGNVDIHHVTEQHRRVDAEIDRIRTHRDIFTPTFRFESTPPHSTVLLIRWEEKLTRVTLRDVLDEILSVVYGFENTGMDGCCGISARKVLDIYHRMGMCNEAFTSMSATDVQYTVFCVGDNFNDPTATIMPDCLSGYVSWLSLYFERLIPHAFRSHMFVAMIPRLSPLPSVVCETEYVCVFRALSLLEQIRYAVCHILDDVEQVSRVLLLMINDLSWLESELSRARRHPTLSVSKFGAVDYLDEIITQIHAEIWGVPSEAQPIIGGMMSNSAECDEITDFWCVYNREVIESTGGVGILGTIRHTVDQLFPCIAETIIHGSLASGVAKETKEIVETIFFLRGRETAADHKGGGTQNYQHIMADTLRATHRTGWWNLFSSGTNVPVYRLCDTLSAACLIDRYMMLKSIHSSQTQCFPALPTASPRTWTTTIQLSDNHDHDCEYAYVESASIDHELTYATRRALRISSNGSAETVGHQHSWMKTRKCVSANMFFAMSALLSRPTGLWTEKQYVVDGDAVGTWEHLNMVHRCDLKFEKMWRPIEPDSVDSNDAVTYTILVETKDGHRINSHAPSAHRFVMIATCLQSPLVSAEDRRDLLFRLGTDPFCIQVDSSQYGTHKGAWSAKKHVLRNAFIEWLKSDRTHEGLPETTSVYDTLTHIVLAQRMFLQNPGRYQFANSLCAAVEEFVCRRSMCGRHRKLVVSMPDADTIGTVNSHEATPKSATHRSEAGFLFPLIPLVSADNTVQDLVRKSRMFALDAHVTTPVIITQSIFAEDAVRVKETDTHLVNDFSGPFSGTRPWYWDESIITHPRQIPIPTEMCAMIDRRLGDYKRTRWAPVEKGTQIVQFCYVCGSLLVDNATLSACVCSSLVHFGCQELRILMKKEMTVTWHLRSTIDENVLNGAIECMAGLRRLAMRWGYRCISDVPQWKETDGTRIGAFVASYVCDTSDLHRINQNALRHGEPHMVPLIQCVRCGKSVLTC